MPGVDRIVFSYGPRKNICDVRVHAFCSDLSELVVGAYTSVRKKIDAKNLTARSKFSFWKRDVVGDHRLVYRESTLMEMNRFVHPEAARLEYELLRFFKKTPQDSEEGEYGKVYLDRSKIKVGSNGSNLSLSYRLRFHGISKNMMLGLGTLNEVQEIIGFLSSIPKRRSSESKNHVKRLSGNRALKTSGSGAVSICDSDESAIWTFTPFQWNEFIKELEGIYTGYDSYLNSLVNPLL